MRLGQTSVITFLARLGSSALGFVATVYFAQVLGAEVLGIYFLTLATVSWLKLGNTIGITSAVTKRVSEQQEQRSFVVAGLLLVLVLFLVMSLAIYLFRGQVNEYLGASLYQFVILVLGAEVAYSYVGAVIKGERLVHIEGLLSVFQTACRILLQVAAVVVGFTVSGLLFGEVTAFVVATVTGILLLVTYFDRPLPIVRPKRRHFRSIIDFAKYSWLGQLRGSTYNMMDTIVLGFFVPSRLIGIYVVCWNISSVLEIFAKSVSNTFFPEMSKLSSDHKDERVARYLTDSLAFSGLFIVPGFVGALVIGEGLLNLYSTEFRKGYTILVILVAATLFNSYHKQFISTLEAVDRPDISFRINIFFVVTNLSMNVGLVYLYGWIGAAVATFLSMVASMVLAYVLTRSLLDFTVPYTEIARQVVAALLMGVVVYALVLAINSLGFNALRVGPVFAAVGLGAATYFACLFVISPRFRTTLADNLPVDIPLA
jgi:O-antigen/teichoic acid export membrane protein